MLHSGTTSLTMHLTGEYSLSTEKKNPKILEGITLLSCNSIQQFVLTFDMFGNNLLLTEAKRTICKAASFVGRGIILRCSDWGLFTFVPSYQCSCIYMVVLPQGTRQRIYLEAPLASDFNTPDVQYHKTTPNERAWWSTWFGKPSLKSCPLDYFPKQHHFQ